jgi:Tol biopolymer transport system component
LRRGRWTPDGRGLAYAEKGNIWVQSLDGGQPRQLTKFTDQEITDFAWSPDGKRLAVSRRTDLADVVLIKGVK